MSEIILEACVEGLDQALKAAQLGADRIELCSRLDLDGLTPDPNIIRQARKRIDIPIRVMIRPRAGDFNYTSEEIAQMKQAIAFCREQEVEGVVFGVLDKDQEIDLVITRELIDSAGSLKTIFHRAIESTSSISTSIGLLYQQTSIDAVLVSGTGGGKAIDHAEEFKNLIRLFKERELVVCGKVTEDNLEDVHQAIGARSYHGKLIVGDLKSR